MPTVTTMRRKVTKGVSVYVDDKFAGRVQRGEQKNHPDGSFMAYDHDGNFLRTMKTQTGAVKIVADLFLQIEMNYNANNVDNASAPSGGVQDAQKKPVDKPVANKCAECACEVYEKLEGYTICACGHLHPLVDADKLRSKLRDAAQLLASDGRLIPLAEADKLRGVAFVEGAGMFILRDYAYGVRDLDMSELRRRYPNKVVYFIGAAEVMEVK